MKKKIPLLLIFVLITILFAPLKKVDAASVKLNATKKTLYIDSSYTLKVSGTQKKVMWKSSNSKIASVSKTGVVKAVKSGKVTITATIGAGSNNIKLTCNITVKSRLSTSLKGKALNCPLDEFQEILITFVKPKDGEYLTATFDSEYIDIEFGESEDNVTPLYVTPIKKGIATITISIAKDESTNSDETYTNESEDIVYFDDISGKLAEKEYLFREFASISTYNPIKITVNIGIDDSTNWIGVSDLSQIYDVTVLDLDDHFSLLYGSTQLTGMSSSINIAITTDEIVYGNEYVYDSIRYKYLDADTIQFNLSDLRNKGIIK